MNPPNFLAELFGTALDPGYGEAAARTERRREPSRLATATRLAALAAIGFLLAVAYREAVAGQPDRSQAHAGLVDQVRAAQARTDELQRRSDELRQQVTSQQRAALGGTSEELQRLRQQEAATGLAAVTGSGAVVTLADAPAQIDPNTGRSSRAEVSRVLDVDLQAVVNGLWAGGAEAVAVNGQRLTSTSTIRAAGSAILVDFRPVTSPYEVTAIGPADLSDRFSSSGVAAATRGLVDRYGLSFSVRPERDLRLPAASERSLRHAHPATSATSTPTGSPR